MTPENLKLLFETFSGDEGDFSKILALDDSLDKFFGINPNLKHPDLTEFSDCEDAYVGLDKSALSTSYVDYYKILNSLAPGKVLIDIGAGYCRGTLLSEFLAMNSCVSVEMVSARSGQAISFLEENNLNTKLIHTQQLSKSTPLPPGDAFYFYFPKGRIFYEILLAILKSKHESLIYICESHGDMIEFFEAMPNLFKLREQLPLSLPRHKDHINIYQGSLKASSIARQDNLCEWFLQKHNSNLVVEFVFFHKILKAQVVRLIPIKKLDIVFYAGWWCLEHIVSGRIFNLKTEFEIQKVKNLNEYSSQIQSLFGDERIDKERLLKSDKYFWEDKIGQVFPIDHI